MSVADLPDLALRLPARSAKEVDGGPRRRGLTMMIDPGLPLGAFTDVIASHSSLVDHVKFGWCTALVDLGLVERKIEVLLAAGGIGFFFGGTLLERALAEDRPVAATLDAFTRFCEHFSCPSVEVSDGTVSLPPHVKARCIGVLGERFGVFSEVGYKDADRADDFGPQAWVEAISADLSSGARFVITESRESGSSGIAHRDGSLRTDVVEAITGAGIAPERLVFEAPTKSLQVDYVQQFGPDVNLGNIAADDLVGLETLRLGLRSDTLLPFLAGPSALAPPAQAPAAAPAP